MRLSIFGTTLATVLLALGLSHEGLQAARAKNIPLRIQFADGASDNIRSDGIGTYQDGVSGVVAYINSAFGWSLTFATNTFDTGGRQLNFFFGNCLLQLPEICDPPFQSANAVAQIQAAPRDVNGLDVTNGLLGMPVGPQLRAFIQLRVLGQPDEWTLCMKPENDGFCALSDNATYARVQRVSSSSWEFLSTATPDTYGRSDIADLLKTTGNGKRKTVSVEGTFSMPFQFTATCVNAAECS
jgi:hypothetical protein